MGENHYSALPVAVYGGVLLLASIAYMILARIIVASEGRDSLVAQALGKDAKGSLSIVVYAAAIPLAFVASWAALLLYALVALMWLIPDRRIEQRIAP
jgi:uncharacterized membrane protein